MAKSQTYFASRDRWPAAIQALKIKRAMRRRAPKATDGRRLVDQCIHFAKSAGYERMLPWTNDILIGARRIYEAAGFSLVEESPHHSFGHDLVGQICARTL
jgi:GNAT superfamily N-acetyltransferase